MRQKALSNWLKFILIGIGLCGLVMYFLIVPVFGSELVGKYPEFSNCYYPWVIFLWLTAVPCYGVLVFGWKIASNIGIDNSFSSENANALKWISLLAAIDTVFFFAVNVVYLLLGMNHPSIVMCSMIVVFAGVAVTVAAAVLSHLVLKAADLQEQSDLTI